MGKHHKPDRRWSPYVTTAVALPIATLFGFSSVTGSNVMPDGLLAATTSIFVDGTKSLTGSDDGDSPFRMEDSFQGKYATSETKVHIGYPRSLGPATGFGDPTYDASEGEATDKIVAAVKAARDDPANAPDATIYVVGYSQGAGAASVAMAELERQGYTDNVEFVLAANPRRNDGGILTRLPMGVYLPVFGVTFGQGTSPQSPDTRVLQVTKQYDGVGDAPNYLFNVVAGANAILGYYYLHPGYYQDVDPDDPSAIRTMSADGRITDVLIPAKVGELPLTMPLLQLGVPRSVVEALDPFLRAVIETGYSRPTSPNSYPSQPVPFQLVPPPDRWIAGVQSIAAGAVQTTQALPGAAASPEALIPNGNVNLDGNQMAFAAPVPVSEDVETPLPEIAPAEADIPETEPAVDTPTEATGTSEAPPSAKPPRPFRSGWRPGDLVGSLLDPKPSASDSPPDDEPKSSKPPAAPSEADSDPADSDPADSDPAGSPTGKTDSAPAA